MLKGVHTKLIKNIYPNANDSCQMTNFSLNDLGLGLMPLESQYMYNEKGEDNGDQPP